MKKRNIKEIANQMVVCLSREIKDNEKVFHGVNSQIPMVAIFLAKKMHAPNLVLIEVAGSINPEPRFMPKSTNGPELCHGSASLFSNADTYDLFARGEVDLIFLGGAQIDKNCNVNMSYIGDPNKPKVRLPGGGGGSVIMSQAKRTIIWKTKHDKRVFVDASEEDVSKYSLMHGDFLFNTRNTPELVGKCCAIAEPKPNMLFNNNILRLRFSEQVRSEFVALILNTPYFKKELFRFVNATTSVAAIYQKNLFSIGIPLPDIEVQNSIVEAVLLEKKLLESNWELIKIYTQKIQDRMSKVWGE